MTNFLNYFSPNPVLIDFGLVKIYWYGLLLCMAVLFCLAVLLRVVKREEKERALDLVFYLLIFGFIGARLWHVIFYNYNYFYRSPLEIFYVWHGGMSIFGGITAGFATLLIYTKKRGLNFWRFADYLAIVLPLGQAIGRWGNYFNQELFGPPCNNSWCVFIERSNRPQAYADFSAFHPLFLYESILCFFLFAFCYYIFRKREYPIGAIALMYLIGYSAIRFILEFYRLDSGQFLFCFKATQWLCLAVILSSVLFLIKKIKIHK